MRKEIEGQTEIGGNRDDAIFRRVQKVSKTRPDQGRERNTRTIEGKVASFAK
ncbi:MAG: hypothetical protein U9P70_03590 [Patescibacteria group bacterium]|nr:hypothetical protein [Patescibacteria group bacterium]